MIIAFIIAFGMNFYAYYYSDQQVLSHYQAIPIYPQDASGLYEIVQALTERAGLPNAKSFIFIPGPISQLAFATGGGGFIGKTFQGLVPGLG